MKEEKRSVDQDQVHDLLFNREIGWQEIIYDLINTEQLDPWDINISVLSESFFVKIREYEETDFFVSSKVLLAAALLLRIKSEILLNKYVKSIDDILFGGEDKKKYELERIELEGDIPELVPRSPMPRYKKVTLKELIESLNKAISTENRRIKKEIVNKNALREIGISIPKSKSSIKDKLKEIQERLFGHFKKNEHQKKVSYSDFIGKDRDERIASFFPLLQLENNGKLWLHQEEHFDEIHIWLKKVYLDEHGDPFADLKEIVVDRAGEEIVENKEESKYLDLSDKVLAPNQVGLEEGVPSDNEGKEEEYLDLGETVKKEEENYVDLGKKDWL